MKQHTTIGIDLAKSVFEVAISRSPGKIAERKRLSREGLLSLMATQAPATVVMEACGSAHHWGRQIERFGHHVELLNPRDVRPYAQGRSKTDRGDAAALLEAHRCAQLIAVPIKTVEQQGMTALHRLRSGWVATRTARFNAIRGLLRELGILIPVGSVRVLPALRVLLEDADSPLPMALRPTLWEVAQEVEALTQRLKAVERQMEALARQTPAVVHLRSVPGIGLLTATALVAFIGDARRFASGRKFASFLGLVPREHSSGLVRRIGSITKRGDPYLRTLFIHGARSVLRAAKKHPDRDALHNWALEREQRGGYNKAAVALANKNARIAWRVWIEDRDYQPRPIPVAA